MIWRLFLTIAMATTIVACGGPPSGGSSVDTSPHSNVGNDVGFEDATDTNDSRTADTGTKKQGSCKGKADCPNPTDPCSSFRAKEWLGGEQHICEVPNGRKFHCTLTWGTYKKKCTVKCGDAFFDFAKKVQKCTEQECRFSIKMSTDNKVRCWKE